MIKQITFSAFCDAFRNADRNENFSYDGKRALYDYLEDYADQTGEEVELDVIAFCCEYSEDDMDTIINSYSIDVSEAEDDEEKAEIVAEYLNDHTLNIGQLVNGCFIYAQF